MTPAAAQTQARPRPWADLISSSGVAVLIEALTNNRNRTAANVHLAFGKNGGNLGETGCVG